MRTKWTLAAVLLSLFAWSWTEAATVTLKDGSRLHGTVTGQTSDGIELSTPDGTLHIGTSRLLNVDYADEGAPPNPVSSPRPAISTERSHHMISLGIGFDAPTSHVDFRSIPGGGEATNGDLGVQFSVQYLYFLTPQL